MSTLTSQPWFYPALFVVIGLPIALLVLNELSTLLVRRGSAYAKPVALLRNWLLPAFALYLLVDQLNHSEDASANATWTKIAGTLVGFLIMLLVLSGANAALFGEARKGSWRERLPGIFIDLGRFILILIGIGLLLSWVWGANIGGLITAVGVTSIVIGLAVQSAVGPVISGLLLLFEQPFKIGEWLDTAAAKGRVVEVNWRAIHIDTGNGIQIVPNAMLATGSFTNLSRATGAAFMSTATLTFDAGDPPGAVAAALRSVAEALPAKLPGVPAKVVALGEAKYKVLVPIASPSDESSTKALLLHRAWYAGQRSGLHLDAVKSGNKAKKSYLADGVRDIASGLGLDAESTAAMAAGARLLRFAEGEIIHQVNTVPDEVGFITEGVVGMFARAGEGRNLPIGELGVGDYFGGTALTRQRAQVGLAALTDATIIGVPRRAMEEVVRRDHRLARQIGDSVEMRRKAASAALEEAAQGLL